MIVTMVAREERERGEGLDAYLASLRYSALRFVVATPKGEGKASARRGDEPLAFWVHSALGLGLRRECRRDPPCEAECLERERCPYGRLIEPGPGTTATGAPLAGVARIPVPWLVRAHWTGDATQLRLVLLGDAAADWPHVVRALESVERKDGTRCHLVDRQDRKLVETIGRRAPAGAGLTIDLLTPVRILRRGRLVRSLELADLVRDIALRLAVWGHYHQGLPWPEPWRFLLEEARTVTVLDRDLRRVRFERYSARQRRSVPLTGWMGRIDLGPVSAELAALLRAGAVAGVGKGASIGLGWMRVTPREVDEWV